MKNFIKKESGLILPEFSEYEQMEKKSEDKNLEISQKNEKNSSVVTAKAKNFALYILDFDGNILKTDTPIYFQNKVTGEVIPISTHELDQNPEKYYHPEGDFSLVNHTFMESRENFPHSTHRGFNGLTDDISKAIEHGEFAPSFEVFKKIILIEARIFSILTARGNSPDNFERGFTMIANDILTAEEKELQRENIIRTYRLNSKTRYEDALHFYMTKVASFVSCSNPHVEKFLGLRSVENLAERKAKSIPFIIKNTKKFMEEIYPEKTFKEILNGRNLAIGFSDDSTSNAITVYKKFEKIMTKDDWIPKKMSVFFTGKESDREKVITWTGAKNWKIKDGALKLKVTL